MKKYISIVFSIIMIVCCMCPLNVLAFDESRYDCNFTNQEFNSLEHVYADTVEPYSSGLITDHELGIAKKNKNLLITGSTYCITEVVKCGFTKVIIQRKNKADSSWTNYKEFEDLYNENSYYKLSKSVPVETGYQYRVKAIHYAKKTLLSTQKIEAVTPVLSF